MNTTEKLIGGFSRPSKMPCFCYGISALKCGVGSILAKIDGTVCSICYARKGQYRMDNVAKAHARRLDLIEEDIGAWTENMVRALSFAYRAKDGKDQRVFRWHDSGDLQSLEHLDAIVEIARALPSIQFWLPTREYATVRDWTGWKGAPEPQSWAGSLLRKAKRPFPDNLVVRVSAAMRGAPAPYLPGCVGSSVDNPEADFQCGAYERGGECGPCRKCWDPTVRDVSYPPH